MALQPLEAPVGPGTDVWPLRIAVVGSSVTLQTSPVRRPTRADGTYGEVLGRTLRAGGLRADVVGCGRWFEMVHEGSRRWWSDVRPLFPDVVVLHYGIVEAQPHVVPTFLARHLFSVRRGTGPVEVVYRRLTLPVLWPAVRRWQRWAAARDGLRTARLSERRFEAELARLVAMARADGALVLVLDHASPGTRLEHFLPGMERRWARHRAAAQRVVAAAASPEVRFVSMEPVVDALGSDATVPDGLHLTPEGHRLVAGLLAAEVADWVTAADPRKGAVAVSASGWVSMAS